MQALWIYLFDSQLVLGDVPCSGMQGRQESLFSKLLRPLMSLVVQFSPSLSSGSVLSRMTPPYPYHGRICQPVSSILDAFCPRLQILPGLQYEPCLPGASQTRSPSPCLWRLFPL